MCGGAGEALDFVLASGEGWASSHRCDAQHNIISIVN